MPKEIPILYSTFMAQAKLAGRKTQTRRIVKGTALEWLQPGMFNPGFVGSPENNLCPYGQPGDLLWGRECWAPTVNLENKYWHKASADEMAGKMITWKPSIHMPKSAARIWDEVTGIRVERVADISEKDCIAEGIECANHSRSGGNIYKNYDGKSSYEYHPRDSFRSLWQLINGKPKPIQSKQGGKLITTGYEVYPFDEQAAAEFKGLTTWKGKPLTVITNPWVWVIESKQLSVTGKP